MNPVSTMSAMRPSMMTLVSRIFEGSEHGDFGAGVAENIGVATSENFLPPNTTADITKNCREKKI